jgi:hypothetical protein
VSALTFAISVSARVGTAALGCPVERSSTAVLYTSNILSGFAGRTAPTIRICDSF